MRHLPPILGLFILAATAAPHGAQAQAQARYGERPPAVVSPDLSAPWVLQLQRAPAGYSVRVAPAPPLRQREPAMRQKAAVPPAARATAPDRVRTAAVQGAPRTAAPRIDPKFLPQVVDYEGPHRPGTVVIDTQENMLYLVEEDGKARRYGVGTGKPGFEWAGTHKVTQKREWPDWRPPAEMIAREKKKGRILPVHMKGGLENPMGARALSRLDALPHPRHQPAVDDRPRRLLGLHPHAQRGRDRPLRTGARGRDRRGNLERIAAGGRRGRPVGERATTERRNPKGVPPLSRRSAGLSR